MLLAALATACATGASFTEASHAGQLVLVVAACILAAALEAMCAYRPPMLSCCGVCKSMGLTLGMAALLGQRQ